MDGQAGVKSHGQSVVHIAGDVSLRLAVATGAFAVLSMVAAIPPTGDMALFETQRAPSATEKQGRLGILVPCKPTSQAST